MVVWCAIWHDFPARPAVNSVECARYDRIVLCETACHWHAKPIDYVFRIVVSGAGGGTSKPQGVKRNGEANLATKKTYMARPGDIEPKWWVVDAADKVVGRLASDIAMILMGKHRATYTPHVDTGDFVVVVNASKLAFTGKKAEQKRYTWYTGWTRLRAETAGHRLARKPERVLTDAVRRMLPKNKLAVSMLTKMKVYAGNQHPHQAQQPEPIELGVRKASKAAAKA
jgi:large subunit ribosomal protein L13